MAASFHTVHVNDTYNQDPGRDASAGYSPNHQNSGRTIMLEDKTKNVRQQLTGPDGGTLLGFLCVLGAVTVLTRQGREVNTRWVFHEGRWLAEIQGNIPTEPEKLSALVFASLEKQLSAHPLFFTCLPDHARAAEIARWHTRTEWLHPVCLEGAGALLDTTTQLTPWYQLVRRDYWQGVLQKTFERTEEQHITQALYGPWNFPDPFEGVKLRLTPLENRRHARQWYPPSNDPARYVWGAMLGGNRLALETHPWWEAISSGQQEDELSQVGHSRGKEGWCWTWPLWSDWVTVPTLRTLLTLTTLLAPFPTPELRQEWHALGLNAVFRVRRFIVGKTLNFTSPECLMAVPIPTAPHGKPSQAAGN